MDGLLVRMVRWRCHWCRRETEQEMWGSAAFADFFLRRCLLCGKPGATWGAEAGTVPFRQASA